MKDNYLDVRMTWPERLLYLVIILFAIGLVVVSCYGQEVTPMPHRWTWSCPVAGKPFIVFNLRVWSTNLPSDYTRSHWEYVEPLNATNKTIHIVSDRVLHASDLGDPAQWPITMSTTSTLAYSSRIPKDGFAVVSTSNTLSGAEWFAGETFPRKKQ